MSHFLFCIKEYTIKQGSNWLSFSFNHTNICQHNGRLFGDFVVLLLSTFSTFGDIQFIMTFAPLIGVLMATLNVAQ